MHVLRELLARRIIRTKNAPAGDYAEYLTQVVLGGGLAAPSVKSYDVITADHRRIQVKARLADATAAEKRVQFSAFRSWDFDEAISIVFNEDDYRVLWAISVPAESLRAASRNQTWVNADTVVRSRSQLASLPGAEDLTVAFRQAVAQLEASIQSTPD